MKIAFIGTHGVGKTTLCYELAAALKRLDLSVDLVKEVARDCPLPINRETTDDAQNWILHTQVAREIALSNAFLGLAILWSLPRPRRRLGWPRAAALLAPCVIDLVGMKRTFAVRGPDLAVDRVEKSQGDFGHHVIPQALPGMLTGTIIGMSRALGETAPLLMIGMVAFIVDVPASFTDPATALPVQIYLWADSPERAFAERTAAAIIVLLGFLLLMNLAAVILRHLMERRT